MHVKVTRTQIATQSKGNALSFHNVVAGGFSIRDITLVEGKDGAFASYPSRKYKNKSGDDAYSDYVWPESTEDRDTITNACVSALAAAKASSNTPESETSNGESEAGTAEQ